jgi:putative ABC transport system substrate-binding protein
MQLDRLKRREFIAVVGGAAAWPLAAGAQQVSGVPRIGYLSPGSASSGPLNYYDEFRRELRELGYIEGQNIVIDYRFADETTISDDFGQSLRARARRRPSVSMFGFSRQGR